MHFVTEYSADYVKPSTGNADGSFNCKHCGTGRWFHAKDCPNKGGKGNKKEERNAELFKDYNSGMSYNAICDKYQLSRARVWDILQNMKKAPSSTYNEFLERNAKIKELYNSGVAVKELQKIYSLTKSRIGYILRDK